MPLRRRTYLTGWWQLVYLYEITERVLSMQSSYLYISSQLYTWSVSCMPICMHACRSEELTRKRSSVGTETPDARRSPRLAEKERESHPSDESVITPRALFWWTHCSNRTYVAQSWVFLRHAHVLQIWSNLYAQTLIVTHGVSLTNGTLAWLMHSPYQTQVSKKYYCGLCWSIILNDNSTIHTGILGQSAMLFCPCMCCGEQYGPS